MTDFWKFNAQPDCSGQMSPAGARYNPFINSLEVRMVLPNGQFRFVFFPENYEAAVDFYRNGLSLPVDHDWDFGPSDRGIVFIAGGGMIELLGRAPGSEYVRPQGTSLLIQVEDADAFYETARQRGLAVVQEPQTFPWGQRIVRLQDPDGIMVSFFHPVPAQH